MSDDIMEENTALWVRNANQAETIARLRDESDAQFRRIAELEAERDEQMDKAIGAWQLLGAADMQIEHLTHNLSISAAKVAKGEARLAAVIALCEPHVRLDANTDAALLHWAIDKIRAAATGDQQ